MNNNQSKATVGALLHDIGKIILDNKVTHSETGYEFVKNNINIPDADILEQIKYHHSHQIKTSEEDISEYAYVTYFADSISAMMDRRTKDDGTTKSETVKPLESIFNLMNLDSRNSGKKFYYAPECINSDGRINYPSENKVIPDKKVLQNIRKEIEKVLKDSFTVEELSKRLLTAYEKNLSFISASVTNDRISDISLYDHLRITAALSSSIAVYLDKNRDIDAKDLYIKEDEYRKEKMFILYSMDVSGIQDFIYTISTQRVLKGLRTRSFYLEMLIEHCIDTLLEKTGFTRVNLIYSGGGHAYAILPNTEEVKGMIEECEKEINKWFMDTYGTALYIASGYTECCANDFCNEPEGSYSDMFRSVSRMISDKKMKRYSSEIIRELNKYKKIDGTRECSICHRNDRVDDTGKCDICTNIENISRNIMKKDIFAVVEDISEYKNYLPLPFNSYLVPLTDKESAEIKKKGSCTRVYRKNSLDINNADTQIWVGDYNKGGDFETLANMSKGIKRIAVMRADVDNLGQAFVSGFRSSKNGDKYSTLSRTASFSRKLSMFFKLNLNNILLENEFSMSNSSESEDKGRNAVVVYAGGDDLFIIGAWNDVIEFSVDLNRRFKKFTQDTLSLSAGIDLYPQKFPVAVMAENTGELEEISKSIDGKNAVTLIDEKHSYPWNEFIEDVLEDKFVIIRDFFEEQNERGGSFAHKLLELFANREEKINLARLAYTLARLEPDVKKMEDNKEEKDRILENYRGFSSNVYNWMKKEKDSKEVLTALVLYIFSIRERMEDSYEDNR